MKPTLTTLTTLTTLDLYTYSTCFSPTLTATLFRFNLLCQNLPNLVDHLCYFYCLIGSPDILPVQHGRYNMPLEGLTAPATG